MKTPFLRLRKGVASRSAVFISQFLNFSISQFAGLLVAASCSAAAPTDDVVLRAMADELSRSIRDLRLENLPRPYYIDQLVLDSDTFSAAAVFGGLARARRSRSRSQVVNVRVGDYQFDNTNFVTGPGRGAALEMQALPLEDDYYVLRRDFWLATDEAYKAAVEA